MKIHITTAIKSEQPEFLTLQQVKDHLKIDFNYEDDLIKSIIIAAVENTEDYTGLQIRSVDVVMMVSKFPITIDVPILPILNDAFLVTYLNVNNAETPLNDVYSLRNYAFKKPIFEVDPVSFILPKTYASNIAVRFSYTAGFTKANLPEVIKQAMLLQIAEMYEFRTNKKEITSTRAMALMRPYKLWN